MKQGKTGRSKTVCEHENVNDIRIANLKKPVLFYLPTQGDTQNFTYIPEYIFLTSFVKVVFRNITYFCLNFVLISFYYKYLYTTEMYNTKGVLVKLVIQRMALLSLVVCCSHKSMSSIKPYLHEALDVDIPETSVLNIVKKSAYFRSCGSMLPKKNNKNFS